MIEIKKVIEGQDHQPAKYGVFIDGNLVDGVEVQTFGIDDADISSITTTTQDATNQLLGYSFLELQSLGAANLRLYFSVDWNEAVGQLWTMGSDDEDTYSVYLLYSRIARWRRVYTFDEYFNTLRRHSKETPVTELSLEDVTISEYESLMPFNVFVINFPNLAKTKSIRSELDLRVKALRRLHQNVERELEARFPIDKVEVLFNFPEEVRVPCEQYLLYFVQFLKDLGVEATADLRHDAGSVLFSVTPEDKDTALDNIRTALGTYLQLSSSPLPDTSLMDIEAQRLAATVEHLRSQIRLKVAEIQLKDATIQTQKVTIDHLLSGDVLLQSVKDVLPKKGDDKESLLGGMFALTKHNFKGLELNYPEMFRLLRRLFKKDATS
jgi:hypothetical protein